MNLYLLERINLRFFILNIFFLYYETKYIPGTLHGLLLLSGIGLVLIKWFGGNREASVLTLDLFLGYLLILIILVSFATQTMSLIFEGDGFFEGQFLNLRAYLFMPLTFIYLRLTFNHYDYNFFINTCKWFLISNSILMTLQLLTGSFYIAQSLAAGEGSYYIPSGWFDGPTKNGMIIAFSLGIYFGKFLFINKKFSLLDWSALMLGLITLPIAASRAGLISSVAVLTLAIIMYLFMRLIEAQNLERKLPRIVSLFSFALLAVAILAYSTGVTNFTQAIESFGEDAATAGAIVYKATNILDDSISERFTFWEMLLESIRSYPLVLLTTGWGPGYFEVINMGDNMHNSYLELFFQLGLMGFVVFITLFIFLIKRSKIISNLYLVPIFLGLISTMVFMMAHDVLRGRLVWMSLGIIGALTFHLKSNSYSIK